MKNLTTALVFVAITLTGCGANQIGTSQNDAQVSSRALVPPATIVKNLEWTYSSDSLQGVLFDGLDSLAKDQSYNDIVQASGNKRLFGSSAISQKIECASTTLGMAQVMSYRCDLHLNALKMDWTSDSRSTQAILFKILSDDNSGAVKKVSGKLILKSGKESLACESHALGMLMVQSYSCEFAFKK